MGEKARLRTELDAALEVVAKILRVSARFSFGLGPWDAQAIASTFEKWAAHTLAGTGTDGPDWRGLVEFFTRHAESERAWVLGSTRDMGDAIFALVDSFRRTSNAQGRQDDLLTQRLHSLNAALETGSVEGLQREARAIASAVTQVIGEQRAAVELQAKELRDRLALVGEQLEQTRREGETDALTKLANRRVFDASLPRSLAVAEIVGRPLTLMMVDIDHFKAINDGYGHVSGDEVLRAVANALARAFPRRSDLVARYGGEEFSIVLADTGHDDVTMLCDRLLCAVRALRVDVGGGSAPLSVTVSIGVAVTRDNERDVGASALVVRADRALYAAKRSGRDRAVVAGESEESRASL